MVEHSLKLLASEEKAISTILSKGTLSNSILSTGTLSSSALPSSGYTLARAASRAIRTHLWLDRASISGVLHSARTLRQGALWRQAGRRRAAAVPLIIRHRARHVHTLSKRPRLSCRVGFNVTSHCC